MPRFNADTTSVILPCVWDNLLPGTTPESLHKGISCLKTAVTQPLKLLTTLVPFPWQAWIPSEGKGLKQLCHAPTGLFWCQIPDQLPQGEQCLQEQLWSHPALDLPNREYYWSSSWTTQKCDKKTQLKFFFFFFPNSRKAPLVRTTSAFNFVLMVQVDTDFSHEATCDLDV